MLTNYDKFNGEVDSFLKSKLFAKKYHEVLGVIKFHSIQRPILSQELSKRFRISDVQIREIVKNARRQQHPIGSKNDGYFIASSAKELTEGSDHLKERISSMSYTYDQMWKNFEHDQLELLL